VLQLLAGLLVLLAGCPRPAPQQAAEQPETTDKYAQFGALLRDEQGFYDEFKRLQRLYADPPKLGYAAVGNQVNRFQLASHITDSGAALALTDTATGEEWLLWAWQDQSESPPSLTVITDMATTGGYRLEFNVGGQALAVNLTASWNQGRYLQVSRELMLGGLDMDIRVPTGYTDWVLDGPWLPYRMVPAAHGPYGVVPDSRAMGDWQDRNYPVDAMVPALAAYDRQRGFLLACADEHPRTLDRDYQLSWRVAGDYSAGAQLKLGYRVYDPTQDQYTLPFLPSGYPLRDSIALEPFELTSRSVDQTLVLAQTAEVITLLGQLERAYQFYPRPPQRVDVGSFIDAAAWLSDFSELPDFLRRSTGIWDVKYASARLFDGNVMAGGNIGLGARDLPGGTGLSEQALEVLGQLDPQVLPVLAQLDYLAFSEGDAYALAHPDWLALNSNGAYFSADHPAATALALDVRNPEVAAWAVRKMSRDIADYPQVAGYLFDSMYVDGVEAQASDQGTYYVAWPAACAALCLRTAEEARGARPDIMLAGRPGLSLALPAFCDCYLNGAASFESGDPQQAGALPFANRLSNLVLEQVFGVSPIIAFSRDSLAAQVIATTPAPRGHELSKELEQHAGFAAFAAHQRELRDSGGDLAVIHSNPATSAYAVSGERPASCHELIATLPADWTSASAIWIAFYGIGGSVEVDARNVITILWDGGSWQGKLPGGYWVVEHPEAEDIAGGDAVLVLRKPIGHPPGSRGTSG
jgi:hypothetical protein